MNKKGITTKDINNAISQVKISYDILDMEMNIIVVDFFKKLTTQDVNYSFEDIKNLHIEIFGERKFFNAMGDEDLIPIEEDSFHLYICENFFGIIPNEKSSWIIKLITKDIEDISSTIQEYKKELEQLKLIQEEGKGYKISLLKHYLEKLENAKEQILNFVKDELSNSLKKNKYKTSNIFDWGMYHYHHFPWIYKKEYLTSGLFNKFYDYNLYEFGKLIKSYKTDGDNIFWGDYKNQSKSKDVVDDIKDLFKCHYKLNERKDFIEQVLQLFLEDKFELFCNITPLQIEGLIYDLCLEFDLTESNLLTSSITDKVEILKNKGFLDDDYYEYFAFVFPITRNRVAHGKIIKKNFEHLSMQLLLDFKSICKLFISDKLPINEKLKRIRQTNDDKSLKNLLNLYDIFQSPIHDYYKEELNSIENLKNELKTKLSEKQFIEEFDLNSLSLNEKHTIKYKICEIKKNDMNKSECAKILKLLNV